MVNTATGVVMFMVVLVGGHAVLSVAGTDAEAQCPQVLTNTCFRTPGYSFPAASTPAACCDLCVSDARCGAWTFVESECRLKVAKANDTHCAGGSSGVVRNHTLPPGPPPPGPSPPPSPPPAPAPLNAKSVLFVVVDDLRPELASAYGQTRLVTPHLDAFAATALTFTRAYVQYSHCSPSRNSFLSGRSPQTTGVYNFIDHFREVGANWTALPELYKKHSYYVAGGGKVYHPNKPPNNDGARSWTTYFMPNGDDGGCRSNETIYSNVCPSDEPLDAFFDYNLANKTVEQLAIAKGMGTPFFIAAGIRRPHRVWHVPRRFYNLYANNGTFPTDMPLAKFKTGPVGMPEIAYIDNAWPPFPYNQSVPIPDTIAALGRWGYYASVSFTDFNIGMMLKAVDDLELTSNTIVAIIGDHGWELGEHGEWCKRTNFEVGLRIPFMIRAPHMPASSGRQTRQLAEALDLYRTLASLAGFTVEQIEPGVEGTDLSAVFTDPTVVVKTAAFSQMARCPQSGTLGPDSACNEVTRIDIAYQGYSVRVDTWRYTAWMKFNGSNNSGMYSHANDTGVDFDSFENVNVVGQNPDVQRDLMALLRKRFHAPSA